jgi:hypothetical protein
MVKHNNKQIWTVETGGLVQKPKKVLCHRNPKKVWWQYKSGVGNFMALLIEGLGNFMALSRGRCKKGEKWMVPSDV